MKHLLIGQLGANGDCLYATILARQLRHDHPDAHITWAITSQCKGVLRNNPHIDAIWEIPMTGWEYQDVIWRVFEREALRRLARHEFDHAWLSQISPNNFHNYDGTIRPSILRSYGAPITVPIENVIELDAAEQGQVAAFVARSGLDAFEHRILFECSSRSGQSFITPDLAQDIAQRVYAALPSACVLLSTHLPIELRHANSRNAGELSLRETAGLTHHCTLFVGAGSGGTVAATSTAARQLPMFQLLSASTSVYASFAHDFEHYGLAHEHMVEMTREDPQAIADAIVLACCQGIAAAQEEFGETIPVRFEHYMKLIGDQLLRRGQFLDAAQSLLVTAGRYGWRPELRAFGRKIEPDLAQDPGWVQPHRRVFAEQFREHLHAATGDRA
ncbi:MAG TPA: hypothetical protein VM074_04170 [Solimonas sp.]|nr:hypothetical protein [Solimonas sp.]